VPVDYVVDVLEAATFAPGASGTYSAVAGASALTVAELIALTCRLMDREARALVPGGRLFDDHHAAAIAPYVDVVCRFGDERTRALLGHSAPALSDYFDALLEYAARAHWGKRPLTRQTARICRLPQRKSAC
jgi:hypothetical protein